MNITEASRTCDLSIDTIRFYEKARMLPRLSRGQRGWREFDAQAIDWLKILERLRATGMPMDEMRHFARLVFSAESEGAGAVRERLAILERHRDRIASRKAEILACEAYLANKIAIYTRDLEGTDDYKTHLDG